MSQTFHLCLATDTLAADAQTLGVTIEDLQSIQVEVIVTLAQTNQIAQTANITQSAQQPEWQLQLDYHITLPLKSLAAQLDWPTWQPTQVGFADYLWEQTCLECFLAGGLITDRLIDNSVSINDANEIGIDGVDANKISAYIEINASPSGSYAVYEFNSYRQPSSLPPNPLLQPNSEQRVDINWPIYPTSQSKQSIQSLLKSDSNINIESSTVSHPFTSNGNTDHAYECGFSVDLNQLRMTTTKADEISLNHNIGLLHPCVILSFDKIALYFAPRHATPPDFHQRQYWTAFNP